MATDPDPVECECGAEMDLERTWSRKSIPLVGSVVQYREYICPECGRGARFSRKEESDTWDRATP